MGIDFRTGEGEPHEEEWRVELTPAEIAEDAAAAAALDQEIDEAEKALASETKTRKGEIAERRSELAKHLRRVRERAGSVPLVVRSVADWKSNRLAIVVCEGPRKGLVVYERDLTLEERQLRLDVISTPKRDRGSKRKPAQTAEEQDAIDREPAGSA